MLQKVFCILDISLPEISLVWALVLQFEHSITITMPKSRRNKVVALTKTQQKGHELKSDAVKEVWMGILRSIGGRGGWGGVLITRSIPQVFSISRIRWPCVWKNHDLRCSRCDGTFSLTDVKYTILQCITRFGKGRMSLM